VIDLVSFMFSILFSGDVIHNGMDSDEDNYRMFFYCQTRDNQVSWSYKQAGVNKGKEITDTSLIKKLNGSCS
jgi:hypothetical protein